MPDLFIFHTALSLLYLEWFKFAIGVGVCFLVYIFLLIFSE